MQLIDLQDRKILITGASSGIGRAVAILASKLGASLILCARDEERLRKTHNKLEGFERHKCFAFDIKDFEKYEEVFAKAVSDGRKLDGLVHCAGIANPLPVRAMRPLAVTEIMDVNFHSFLYLMNAYAKRKNSCGGSVVAVSSVNSHYPQKYMSVYAASKAALEAAVKTMSLEVAAQNIRINCVIPGAVETPMMKMTDPNVLEEILSRQLLGVGQPEDIANMAVFLLSDAASFITGRSLYVDGGRLGQ